VPTTVFPTILRSGEIVNVIIGVDPHKATHTAVALDGNELELGEVQVQLTGGERALG
jgi:hypothetical protein